MYKLIMGLGAFCCLVVASATPLHTQQIQSQSPPAQAKPPIRVDENFTGSYDDLIDKEVEVLGHICLNDLGNGKVGNDAFVATGTRGGFELTNWGSVWWKKNVRIIGTVTKGIDDRERVQKEFGNHPPAMVIRVQYLLTIKSIELLEDKTPEPQPQLPESAQVPKLVPQAPPSVQSVPQQAPALAKLLTRIDQNFKGYYGDLIDHDVEVWGYVTAINKPDPNVAAIDSGDRGGFEIPTLDPKWFNKKVRIIGTVTKGIDPYEAELKKNWKPGQGFPAVAFRNFYVLSVKTIDLAEPSEPANPVQQTRPLLQQR